MATTSTEAWSALSDHERALANDHGRDAFSMGFHAGWQAQENRPFHCAHCGFECHGATDGETIAQARDHTKTCASHPLAAEATRLRVVLAEVAAGCGHTRCHAYPWIRAARRVLGV